MLGATGSFPTLSIKILNAVPKNGQLYRVGRIIKENGRRKKKRHERVNKTKNKGNRIFRLPPTKGQE